MPAVQDEVSHFSGTLFELNFDTTAVLAVSPNKRADDRPILSVSSLAFPFPSVAMAPLFRPHSQSSRPLFPSLLIVDRGACGAGTGVSATLARSLTTKQRQAAGRHQAVNRPQAAVCWASVRPAIFSEQRSETLSRRW